MKAKIRSLAVATPKNFVENKDLAGIHGESFTDRFVSYAGIHRRAVVDKGTSTSDLCEYAAMHLLKRGHVPRKYNPTALIFVTQTPDNILPATAVSLAHRLGLPKDAPAFDVNQACAGYVYGLWLSAMLCEFGHTVLLLVGDSLSTVFPRDSKSTGMIFGDCGSATLISPYDKDHLSDFHFHTDGEGYFDLYAAFDGYTNMDGEAVMGMVLNQAPAIYEKVVASSGLKNPDAVLIHQANLQVQTALRKKLNIGEKTQFPTCLEQYGNLSSGSIPFLMSGVGGKSWEPETILLGFGAGWSVAGCRAVLPKTNVFRLEYDGENLVE